MTESRSTDLAAGVVTESRTAGLACEPEHAGPWQIRIVEVCSLPGTPLSAYVAEAPDDVRLDLPCFAWLLTGGTACVLVDTGPDADASGDLGYDVEGDGRAALLHALGVAGLRPADVDIIVHTHLHQDHFQNDLLFPRAQVVVQRRELEAALAGDAACGRLAARTRARLAAGPYRESQDAGLWYAGAADLAAALGQRLRPAEGRFDLLPGLTLMPSGGHTVGHQSVLVTTADGLVCIAGDVIPLDANREVVGPMTPDEEAARAFLRTVRASQWEVLPSHEPALRGHRWFVCAH